MRYWLVMPAAGAGRRAGLSVPKQYAPLAGRTVIEWSLAPFLEDPRCVGRIVALASDDAHWGALRARLGAAIDVAPGGAERAESVLNALRRLRERDASVEWVLVHDAARPCLDRRDLDRLVEHAGAHPVGALLAAPLRDTLKRAGESGELLETLERAGLWRALTPQAVRLETLETALERALAAGRWPTDEAQAIEWVGERLALVEGAATNLKITDAQDLRLAEAILHLRGEAREERS